MTPKDETGGGHPKDFKNTKYYLIFKNIACQESVSSLIKIRDFFIKSLPLADFKYNNLKFSTACKSTKSKINLNLPSK